jgi:hypothetical protein
MSGAHKVPPHTRRMIARNYAAKMHHGWQIMHVFGSAYDRGFAHGYFLSKELHHIFNTLPLIVKTIYRVDWERFVHTSNTEIFPVVKREFREWFDECTGIVAGAKAVNVDLNIHEIIAWNAFESLVAILVPHRSPQKCSAFIAVGNATQHHDVVMAHNTHTNYATGAFENVIMYIFPDKGAPFIMQTAAGRVSSVTDWFVSASGMMGCETTISGVAYRPRFGAPIFCRIRAAMQYGNCINDYANILGDNNAGDYACSWLIGDNLQKEIALIEVGQNGANVQRTHDGVFYGMNSAIDHVLRRDETRDRTQFDIQTSSGARKLRFEQLLFDKYYGNLNEHNAQIIIADHCDVYLRKTNKNQRSICSHQETSHNARNYPAGSLDGKVITTKLARKMQFMARWGAACGRAFNAKSFVDKHPQFKKWESILINFPEHAWTTIQP